MAELLGNFGYVKTFGLNSCGHENCFRDGALPSTARPYNFRNCCIFLRSESHVESGPFHARGGACISIGAAELRGLVNLWDARGCAAAGAPGLGANEIPMRHEVKLF